MIPKFRAWDERAGLTEVVSIDFVEKKLKVSHWEYGVSNYFPLDDVELMQSTGLKGYLDDSYDDSEEKDVFAGDIIDIFWEEWPMGYYQENHMVGVVDKDETGTAWIIKNAKYEYDTPKKIPSEIDGISVSMSLPDEEDLEEIDVFAGDIIDIFWEEWPMGYYQENHMVGVVDKDETGTAWIIKNAKYEYDTPKKIPSEIDGISVSMSLPDEEDLEEIFLHNFNLTSSDVTILGNIYENPELLEVEG